MSVATFLQSKATGVWYLKHSAASLRNNNILNHLCCAPLLCKRVEWGRFLLRRQRKIFFQFGLFNNLPS